MHFLSISTYLFPSLSWRFKQFGTIKCTCATVNSDKHNLRVIDIIIKTNNVKVSRNKLRAMTCFFAYVIFFFLFILKRRLFLQYNIYSWKHRLQVIQTHRTHSWNSPQIIQLIELSDWQIRPMFCIRSSVRYLFGVTKGTLSLSERDIHHKYN